VSLCSYFIWSGPSKKGYQKIKNGCNQAARQGYKYLWVDTCCIDKRSSAELQEAICSMYKWYANARICYVYLEDYEPSANPPSQLSACRWFKRGWTLRRYICTTSKEPKLTYNAQRNSLHHLPSYSLTPSGTSLGRKSLCEQIANITEIDPLVLRGEDPRRRTIAERMSWASGRSTSQAEDVVYSLMGLFDVFMPMLYGEGSRAFVRLQEEILKQSEDYTIFSWKSEESGSSPRGLFARLPVEIGKRLYACDEMMPNVHGISRYKTPNHQLYSPAALTSRGLLTSLPLLSKDMLEETSTLQQVLDGIRWSSFNPFHFRKSSSLSGSESGIYLALICRADLGKDKKSQILCVWLHKNAESGIFIRHLPEVVMLLPENRACKFAMHTIYARTVGSELSSLP